MGPYAQKTLSEYWLMTNTPCQIKLNIMHDVDAGKLNKKWNDSAKDLDFSTVVCELLVLWDSCGK